MHKRTTMRRIDEYLEARPPKTCKRSAAFLCLLVGLLAGVVALRLNTENRSGPAYDFIDRAYTINHMQDGAELSRISMDISRPGVVE